MRIGHDADGLPKAGPYSHALEHDGVLYLSGQTPFDPRTGTLRAGGIDEQTTQCLDNLAAVLAVANLGLRDALRCNVYLVDMDDFAAMNAIYATRFSEPYPARTTVGVAALPLGARIEIDLVARRPVT
jgi:2-iminobutanoate/2-iminopropanoate deaminase